MPVRTLEHVLIVQEAQKLGILHTDSPECSKLPRQFRSIRPKRRERFHTESGLAKSI
jgi:hypothetical protein